MAKAVVFKHEHNCTMCGRRWLHETEKACLAATDYNCPPCKDTKHVEPNPLYGFSPPPRK